MKRTLMKNKTKLWKVSETGVVESVDLSGNFTGDRVKTYSEPVEVFLSMYPTSGDLKQVASGIFAEYDYIAVDTITSLNEMDLLFRTEPTGNYDTTYDFRIGKKVESINTVVYGLKARV